MKAAQTLAHQGVLFDQAQGLEPVVGPHLDGESGLAKKRRVREPDPEDKDQSQDSEAYQKQFFLFGCC
jgi:hypothetical protein